MSDTAQNDTTEKSIPQIVNELVEMVKAYVLQETIDPLKAVGRYVAFGLGGALLGALGLVLLLLAGLRALQVHTGTALTGSWSWAPYAIVLAVSLLLVVVAVSRISQKTRD